MGLFKRKPDPINDRARKLESEIANLEKEIARLSEKLESAPETPKLRSTVRPHNNPAPPSSADPVFEDFDFGEPQEEAPAHYNEMGVRKFDLVATVKRLTHRFRGQPAANPKLVNYLASGSIDGLRPLRYERRVARRRFIGFALLLLVLIFGLIAAIMRL